MIAMFKGTTLSVELLVENLKERHGIRDAQLDCEIEKSDMVCLAQYFDNIGILACAMKLTDVEEEEAKSTINKQEAILKCLQFWKRPNPSQATYRALLHIVLSLNRGDIAGHICQYLGKSNSHYCSNNINMIFASLIANEEDLEEALMYTQQR